MAFENLLGSSQSQSVGRLEDNANYGASPPGEFQNRSWRLLLVG